MNHCLAFKKLLPYLEKERRLKHTNAILYYDIATLCPEKALGDEANLLDYYSTQMAEICQNEEYARLVKEGLNDLSASPMEKRLFRMLFNEVELLGKMPLEDYMKYQSAISASNEMWRKYRPADDFGSWLPYWQKLIDLSRHVADLERKPGMKTRYDACLDSYEPGETEEYLDAIFLPLKKRLIELLAIAKKKQKAYALPPIKRYPVSKQKELSYRMLSIIGYDLKGGCLMESAHPFSNDDFRHDARLTTKFLVEDWRSNVFTCLHEGGHCLEFQNKPREMYDNYVESAATAAICETHSRFYENIVGRSEEFAPFLKKVAAETLDPEIAGIDDLAFYRLINKIEPWLIRCEADELSYCLHIVIRYEIERDLINGKIEGKDVPAIWKRKYREYLGVEVPNDKDGCMQDTHWSEALWGYFPSYALGNIYGAMIAERMEKDIGFRECLRKGEFATILKWFADNDFRYDWMEPGDWIRKVTGSPLTSEPYIRYLTAKFGE
ncbi:MAG: carboxypeptidase M32 [Bacilli bacterium]|jgi:carboxypeptidase Taq|nr:carboxypeptidase M32 [Bacilli bacterium]